MPIFVHQQVRNPVKNITAMVKISPAPYDRENKESLETEDKAIPVSSTSECLSGENINK